MNKTAVGIGEVLWGLLPEGKKLGGAPANFACHVSQFGFDSRIVSAVGHDPLGLEIQETPRVEVADTVGAGGSFTAVFTSVLLHGKPVAEAHRLAVEVSAYVCSRNGAMPGQPGRLVAMGSQA